MPTDTKQLMARLQGIKTAMRIQKGEGAVVVLEEINRLIDLVGLIPQGDQGPRGFPGINSDEQNIIQEVLKKIPKPQDGRSVNLNEVVKEVLRQIPRPQDGQTPVLDYPYIVRQVLLSTPIPQDGQPGKTPVKGKDYLTDADIQEIVDLVLKKVPRVIEKRTIPSISLMSKSSSRSFEIVDSNGVNLGQAVRKIQLGSGLTGTIVGDGVLKIVSSGGTGISGTASFNETPTGNIDDSNAVFTLAHTPSQTQIPLSLFLNGIRQRAGAVDFTLSGGTITFVTPPASGSTLWADYYY